MLGVRGDNGRTEQERTETSPDIGVRGDDLDLGSAMRVVGGEGLDEACHEKDREAVFSGDANEASAGEKHEQSQNLVAGESAAEELDEKEEKRPGGGAETAGVREDQHEARSNRRVVIVCAPRNYKRPQSLQNLKSNGARETYSTTISSGGTTLTGSNGKTTTTTTPILPPAIPPRSPLRPRSHCQGTPPAPVGTTPKATTIDIPVDPVTPCIDVNEDGTQLILMPSLRESFGGSLTALLATLEAETLQDKALPLPPDQEDGLTIDYSDEIEEEEYDPDASQPSSTDSLTLDIPTCPASASPTTPNQPTVMTKRVHALRELLSSERAYTSDLALIRDIHIPLALGRTTGSFQHQRPAYPATLLARFWVGLLNANSLYCFRFFYSFFTAWPSYDPGRQEALGGALDGGSGEDRVGALFLEIIPALEPPYKTYITRHPTALAHLNALPSSPTLSAYLSHTRTLASSLTHAWDLPSLLIKPVQRLLKYSLLLGAIIDATPDSHGDRTALVKARERMEEVARSVNEDRRRWEVVREVLGGAPVPSANGTGKSKKGNGTVHVGMGAAASAHLSRMKSLRGHKTKDIVENLSDNAEALEVARLEGELQRYAAFLDKLAKDVKDWRLSMRHALVALWQWGITFGAVLGLTPSPSVLEASNSVDELDAEGRSEAYDAFTVLLAGLPSLCADLEQELQKSFIPLLCNLKAMMEPPTKLLNAMHSLEPLHVTLLHTPFSPTKSRRPAPTLLTASQSYLALRSALSAEMPILLRAMNKATGLAVRIIAERQGAFYASIGERWAELWDALRVEGERCGGSEETLRVWWERWGDVDAQLSTMRVTRKDKWWAEREKELRDLGVRAEKEKEGVREGNGKDSRPTRRSTAPPSAIQGGATPDSGRASNQQGPPTPSSQAKRQSHQHQSSTDTIPSNRRRSGSASIIPQIQRRPSDESLRSGKSTKSTGKSNRNSRTEDEPPVPRLKPNFSQASGNGPPRTKGEVPPLQTMSSQPSQVFVDFENHCPPSPLSLDIFDAEELDSEYRGRTQRRSSLKSKLTDTFRPAHHRRRSSSVKSLGAPSSLAPSYHSTDAPLPPYSPSHQLQTHSTNGSVTLPLQQARPSPTLAATRALYTTRAIHPCLPPTGVSYRGLPFFQLVYGDSFDVLREYGHPSTHVDLPLYVDDGEDCLLLVRARSKGGGYEASDVGWALASFLLPVD
ncbi:hypothetical protein J3R82DRAFT_3221 [Butyriboletus roseoflavus]|nr:hypothetical protein J3R82DRAFT_3221 [Butyriboletus roseoflavus]